MPELSNTVLEMSKLFNQLRTIRSDASGADVVAGLISVEVNSPEYYSAMSALADRFRRIRGLIDRSPASQELKNISLAAVDHLRQFTFVGYLPGAWNQTKQDIFREPELQAFALSSLMIEKDCRVASPTQEEKEGLIEDLTKAVTSLNNNKSPIAGLLATALETAIRMITYLDFYGAERFSEVLVNAYALNTQAAAIDSQNSTYNKIKSILAACFLILTVPDAGLSALENHTERVQKLIEFFAEGAETEQKLLTGPASVEKPEVDTEASSGEKEPE